MRAQETRNPMTAPEKPMRTGKEPDTEKQKNDSH